MIEWLSENRKKGGYMADKTHFGRLGKADDLFDLKLEERFPSDPGELSGTVLSMLEDSGEYACLSVDVAHHCLGCLSDQPLRDFLHRAVAGVLRDDDCGDVLHFGVALMDLDRSTSSGFSGGKLWCYGVGKNMELAVYFGEHCFGLVKGAVLRNFLLRAFERATEGLDGAAPRPAEKLTKSDRNWLRGVGIKA
jgi:hypothetical protein